MKLRHWYMVHTQVDAYPATSELLTSIRPCLPGLRCDVDIAEKCWTRCEFKVDSAPHPIVRICRILPDDTDFLWRRPGWEESLQIGSESESQPVIEFLREARQSIAIMPSLLSLGSAKLARICEQLCGCVARDTQGLIHVYQEGFFNAEGESIFPRDPRHRLKTK